MVLSGGCDCENLPRIIAPECPDIVRCFKGLWPTEDDGVATNSSSNHLCRAKFVVNRSAEGIDSQELSVVGSY